MSGVAIDVNTRTGDSERELKKINDALQGIKKTTDGVTASLANMAKSIAVSAASIGAFAMVAKISDQFTDLGNKIALVTGRTNELIYAQGKLLDITEETRGSIEGSAQAFGVFGKALKGSGTSVDSLLTATKAVQQAVAISGASADSANAALMQLGQGLGAGVLRGEEFNSVMEQTPRIAMALADSLKISLGQLRAMANEGKLTSEVVFKGIVSQAEKINSEFSQLAPTVSQGTRAVKQGFSEVFNEILRGSGASEFMGASLLKVGKSLRESSKTIGTDVAIMMAEVRLAIGTVSILAKPVIEVFKTLGKTILNALPSAEITRTLLGDMHYMTRTIDDALGGWGISTYRFFKYFWVDLFDIDTPVTLAIKNIQRLAPSNWGSRLNSGAFKVFFRKETLYDYAEAFGYLADAMKDNLDNGWDAMLHTIRAMDYAFQSTLMYLGAIPDTLVKIKLGAFENLARVLDEIIIALGHVQRDVFDFAAATQYAFSDWSEVLMDDILRIFAKLPTMVVKTMSSAIVAVVKLFKALKEVVRNAFYADTLDTLQAVAEGLDDLMNNLGDVFQSPLESGSDVFGDVVSAALAMAIKAGQAIKAFAKMVIYEFFRIWDAVIGHSWWTDTVESVVNTSRELWNNVKSPLQKFSNSVVKVFKGLYKSTSNGDWKSVINLMTTSVRSGFAKARTPMKGWTDYIASSFSGLASTAAESSATFSNVMAGYLNKMSKKDILYSFSFNPSSFQTAMAVFNRFTDDVVSATLSMCSIVSKKIHQFAYFVIEEFKWIWDAVIGHSWWTDTIDGVVDQTNSLVDRTKGGFNRFKKSVEGTFKNITGTSSFADSVGQNMKGLGEIASIMGKELKEKFMASFAVIADQFGVMVKAIAAGVGLVLAAILPLGGFKKIIIFLLLDTFLTAATLLSESFAQRVFGESMTMAAGKSAGGAAAKFVIEFIKEIPAMSSALLGVVSGFVQGFASQIPILGGLIKGLFTGLDAIGLGGVFGLVGTVLFGAGLLPLLGRLDTLKQFGEWMSGLAAWAAAGAGGTGGVISRFLFGTMGYTRVIGALGTIFAMSGGFQSLFSGSFIGQTLATGGFLGMFLFGKKALDFTSDKVYQYIVGPLMTRIKEAVKSVSGGTGGMYSILFGQGGAAQVITQGQTMMTKIMSKLGDFVVDRGAEITKKFSDFMILLLFGTEYNNTINQIKEKSKAVFDKVAESFKAGSSKLGDFLKRSEFIKQMFEGASGKGGISGVFESIKRSFQKGKQGELDLSVSMPSKGHQFDMFGDVAGQASSAKNAIDSVIVASARGNATAAAIGGTNGLLGKVFFGKYGRLAVLGIVLALFAGFATAAESVKGDVEMANYSILGAIADAWKGFARTDPIKTYFLTAIGAIATAAAIMPRTVIPMLTAAATNLAANVGGPLRQSIAGLSMAFDIVKVSAFGQAVTNLGTTIASQMGRIKATMAGAALGGGLAAIFGADSGTIAMISAVGAAAVQMFFAMSAATQAAVVASVTSARLFVATWLSGFELIGGAASRMWLAITGPIGLAVIGFVAVAAALVGIFGEGDGFLSKLDDIVDKLMVWTGFFKEGQSRWATNISKNLDKPSQEAGVKVDYDTKGINPATLDKKIKANIEKIVEELNKALVQAAEEKGRTGEVASMTEKSIRELNKNLNYNLDKARVDSAKIFEDVLKDANSVRQYEGRQFTTYDNVMQYGRTNNYQNRMAEYNKRLSANPGDLEAIKAIEEMKSRKDRDFKQGYTFMDEFTEKLQKTFDSLLSTKDINIAGDPNLTAAEKTENANLARAFSDAVIEYKAANKEYVDAINGFNFSDTNNKITAARLNKDSANAQVSFLGNKLMTKRLEEKAIIDFKKHLTDIDAKLAEIGVSFEENPLFAAGNKEVGFDWSIGQIEAMINKVDRLQKELKRTSTNEAALGKFLEARDAKVELMRTQRQGADNNTMVVDQLLTKSMEKAGVDLSQELFGQLPTELKLSLNKMAQEIERQKDDLNSRKYIIPDGMDKAAKEEVIAAMDAAKLALESKKAEFKATWEKIFKDGIASGSEGRMLQGGKALGLDLTSDLGLGENGKKLIQYKENLREFEEIFTRFQSGDKQTIIQDDKMAAVIKGIESARYYIGKFEEDLKNPQNVLDRMASVNFNATAAQFRMLKSEVVDQVMADAARLKEINRALDSNNPTSKDLPNDQVSAFAKEREAILKRNEALAKKVLPTTFMDKINALGMPLDNALRIGPSTIQKLADMNREIDSMVVDLGMIEVNGGDITELSKRYLKMVDSFRSAREATLNFGEQLDLVNNILVDAKITPKEWASMYDDQRQSVIRLAQETRALNEELDRNTKLTPEQRQALQRKIANNNQLATTPRVNGGLNTVKFGASQLNMAGISGSESEFGAMAPSARSRLSRMAEDLNSKIRSSTDLQGSARTAIERDISILRSKLQEAYTNSISRTSLERIDFAGGRIDQAGWNMVDNTGRALIESLVVNIEKSRKILEDRSLPEATRQAAQNIIDQTQGQLNEAIAKLTMSRDQWEGTQVGQDFAQALKQDIQGGIADVLKGKSTAKEFLLGVVDSFTSGVIDSFVSGLTNSMTSKDGIFNKMMSGIGTSLFGLGDSFFGDPTQNQKDWAADAMIRAADAMNSLVQAMGFSGIDGGIPTTLTPDDLNAGINNLGIKLAQASEANADQVSQSVGGLGGSLQQMMGGLFSIFSGGGGGGGSGWMSLLKIGMQAYGAFSGAGAGAVTAGAEGASSFGSFSDGSSYGSAFNNFGSGSSGGFSFGGKFETGGVVPGGIGMPVPILAHGGEVVLNQAQQHALLKGGTGKGESVFNIHVTGDISRQTRMEIQKMIPMIAGGVNQHNYETGRG